MTNFNYTKRKSEGIKLGQIVAKDLRKRQKLSTNTKTDSGRETVQLDINVEGKNLADDGAAELARGLEEMLRSEAHHSHTRVRSLNMSQNNLSAKALGELAASIDAAASSLEELDISDNGIEITTTEDADQWSEFLKSLQDCRHLTRINLSGNNLGNFKAFEIFCRVYADQYANSVALWDAEASKKTQNCSIEESGIINGAGMLSLDSLKRRGSFTTTEPRTNLEDIQVLGLPGARLIDFSRTGLNDQSALFLSFVIERHRWIHTTLLEHSWGPDQACISTHPNDSLSSSGTRILSLSDTLHDNDDEQKCDEEEVADESNDQSSPLSKYDHSTGKRDPRRKWTLALHKRKLSDSTSPLETPSAKLCAHTIQNPMLELDALRKKAQRSMIEQAGVENVQLWMTALYFLKYVRQIVPESENVGSRRDGPEKYRKRSSIKSSDPFPPLPPPSSSYASKLVVNTGNHNKASSPSTLQGSRTPTTPMIFKLGHHRKNDSPQDSGYCGSVQSSRVASPLEFWTTTLTNEEHNTKSAMIGPLPRRAWELIIANLADSQGILRPHQREAIITYGSSRRTLAVEVEHRSDPDSVQIWRALEAMHCLSYDDGQ